MSLNNNHFIQVGGVDLNTKIESAQDLEDMLLNIMRVNSNKMGVLSAYMARRKCYIICKKLTGRVDYKEYVERLFLDNFPEEFKKAEYGKKILIVLCITVPILVTNVILLGVGIDDLNYYVRHRHDDYPSRIEFTYFVWGLLFLVFSFLGVRRLLQLGKNINHNE